MLGWYAPHKPENKINKREVIDMQEALFTRLKPGDKIRKDGLKGYFVVFESFECGRKIEATRHKTITTQNISEKKWTKNGLSISALEELQRGDSLTHVSSGLPYVVTFDTSTHVSAVHTCIIHIGDAKCWHLYAKKPDDD